RSGGVAVARVLDLDHLGAVVAEDHAGERAGSVVRHLEHPHPGQRRSLVERCHDVTSCAGRYTTTDRSPSCTKCGARGMPMRISAMRSPTMLVIICRPGWQSSSTKPTTYGGSIPGPNDR